VSARPSPRWQYSERIDPVVYGELSLTFDRDDWEELALAALDLAGVDVKTQARIRKELGR
jgi:hypothetical protein